MAAADVPRNFDDGSITGTDDGGNSATLGALTGTYTVSDLHPGGREPVVVQTQGSVIGDRLGSRVFPKISITAKCRRFDEDFYTIANGTIAGYVSTTADIGDGKRFNIQIDESYSTDTRVWNFDDCRATMSYTQSAGSEAEVTIELECIGPVTCDGVTIIAAR